MASRLPAAVDKLRRHLAGAIPDSGDLRMADSLLIDVINSLHDRDDNGGEAEDRDFMIAGTSSLGRSTGDYRRAGMGLDSVIAAGSRPVGRVSGGLAAALKGIKAPRLASTVR